jgi:hypothetical protein
VIPTRYPAVVAIAAIVGISLYAAYTINGVLNGWCGFAMKSQCFDVK